VAAALDEQAIKTEAVPATGPSKLERIINFSGEGGLLEIPPGFQRGLDFSKKKADVDQKEAKDIENVLEEEPADELAQDGENAVNGDMFDYVV